jgi:hypothetical protein
MTVMERLGAKIAMLSKRIEKKEEWEAALVKLSELYKGLHASNTSSYHGRNSLKPGKPSEELGECEAQLATLRLELWHELQLRSHLRLHLRALKVLSTLFPNPYPYPYPYPYP